MFERWETRGERSYTTRYVTKEMSGRSAAFSHAARSQRPESATVDTICRIVGFLMLATTVALFWIMATAT